jgi:RNase adaptor protein for sRNA GlmZ degradation
VGDISTAGVSGAGLTTAVGVLSGSGVCTAGPWPPPQATARATTRLTRRAEQIKCVLFIDISCDRMRKERQKALRIIAQQ